MLLQCGENYVSIHQAIGEGQSCAQNVSIVGPHPGHGKIVVVLTKDWANNVVLLSGDPL